MSFASTSILRHRSVTAFNDAHTTVTRPSPSHFSVTTISAAKQPQNQKSYQSPADKKLHHRAKQSLKDFNSLSPIIFSDDSADISAGKSVGTVAAAQANFMRVVVSKSSGDEAVELLCVVRAVLKKIRRRVLVGDRVLVGSIDWIDRRGMIENVFQRSSEILDPPVANVDHLLVLFSFDQPKPEPFTLTRFLIEAESTAIPITLAFNKSELVNHEEMDSWKSRLAGWGYKPIFCSVESGYGVDSLASILKDQTTVIVGPSGVGKSSLINALRNNPLALDHAEDNVLDTVIGSKWLEEQRVGEVSTRSGRGKHTTRHVSLLPLSGGGYLADTPGFNQPSLLKVTKQSLAQTFPEIRGKLDNDEKCAFKDCLHLGEPGCVIGSDWERYPYYFQLLDEIRIREEFQLRTFGTKKESDVRYKMKDGGVKQAEPRLELKKHRRQSRKSLNQSILDELDKFEEDDSDEYGDQFSRTFAKKEA